ncbi:MAG: hypothetical protein ACMXYC_02245 [Candidatus Woesearchaeota archaeon]
MRFLLESKYLFTLAIVIALIFPIRALEFMLIPILVVMMSVSIKDIAFRHVNGKDIKEIIFLMCVNYVFLGLLYVFLSMFLPSPHKEALIIFGIMPPAVGIISLTAVLHGDTRIAFLTEFCSYFFAVLYIPFMSAILLASGIGMQSIVTTLFLIIILPYILSRFIHDFESKHPHKTDYARIIINICYALSFYIIIASNRQVVFMFDQVWSIYVILCIAKFGIATLLWFVFGNYLTHHKKILLILFATMKNGGAGIVFTTLVLGIEATIIYAVNGIIFPLFIMYLEWLLGISTDELKSA